jgi:hypothetical protein
VEGEWRHFGCNITHETSKDFISCYEKPKPKQKKVDMLSLLWCDMT